jgi:NADH-quinone oxidoreductase subunit C
MPDTEAIALLQSRFPEKVGPKIEFRGEQTVTVDRGIIREVISHLKSEVGFNFLVDISSVDHFGEEPRYEVVYELAILGGAQDQEHLRVKARVSEDDPTIDSIVPVFQGADWHEREIFDMMGLRFNDHPDLRRILMWEGYPDHPLRKDFPLAGRSSDAPGEGFSRPAPLEGGPFVAPAKISTGDKGDAPATVREPRAHPAQSVS